MSVAGAPLPGARPCETQTRPNRGEVDSSEQNRCKSPLMSRLGLSAPRAPTQTGRRQNEKSHRRRRHGLLPVTSATCGTWTGSKTGGRRMCRRFRQGPSPADRDRPTPRPRYRGPCNQGVRGKHATHGNLDKAFTERKIVLALSIGTLPASSNTYVTLKEPKRGGSVKSKGASASLSSGPHRSITDVSPGITTHDHRSPQHPQRGPAASSRSGHGALRRHTDGSLHTILCMTRSAAAPSSGSARHDSSGRGHAPPPDVGLLDGAGGVTAA
jgi:hypothetical protein